MCGRIIIKKSIKLVEEKLQLPAHPNLYDFRGYNIGPGGYAPVMTADKQLHLWRFGLTPFWAKKPMLLFNARSEGDLNKENDPRFTGSKGIIKKPAFRGPIRKQRCIVFVNGFLEGPEKEKLSKPYYVYSDTQEFLGLAAVYDSWLNKETAEEITGFSIITGPSNKVTSAIGHHRSPIILNEADYTSWLNAEHLDEVTTLLQPWKEDDLNAFPISPDIRSPRADDPELLQPIGEPVLKRYSIKFETEFDTQGFGRKKKL